MSRLALIKRATRPHNQRHQQFGQKRFDEPACTKLFRRGMNDPEQKSKSQKVKDRTDKAKDDHEITDEFYIPTMRGLNILAIHVVASNRNGRKIGEKVVEQNLFRQQWEKGQKQRGACHTEHIAKVCAGGCENILERVRKRDTSLFDA